MLRCLTDLYQSLFKVYLCCWKWLCVWDCNCFVASNLTFFFLCTLCLQVIDDADLILERFKTEITSILQDYNLVIVNEMKHYQCPRQILVFGKLVLQVGETERAFVKFSTHPMKVECFEYMQFFIGYMINSCWVTKLS